MSNAIHLVVEKGPDAGKQISVPPEGARLGRSSKNDIVLADALLSRHHCRLFFKTADGLHLTDLGSANGTLVNDNEIQEIKLRVGDAILVGESLIRVMNDGVESAPAAAPIDDKPIIVASTPDISENEATVTTDDDAPHVDLGLTETATRSPRRKIGVFPLIVLAVFMAALAIIVWSQKLRKGRADNGPAPSAPTMPTVMDLYYEKIDADSENAFRYELEITRENKIAVTIDDTQNNRHITRREKSISEAQVQNLIEAILQSGFFDLDENYRGIQPNIYEVKDLTITLAPLTRRVRIENRNEPQVFKELRELIEEFAENEFGLQPIQYSTEELLKMAEDSCLLGQKLYREREIQHKNLSDAIRNFTLADWYLESIEPKPSFYRDVVSGIAAAKEELGQKYENRNFAAQRAMRVKDWDEAERQLKIILEMIPDSTDERNQTATRELLDVQTRKNMEL